MKTIKQLERIYETHKLIQQQNNGTPAEFANKLHISVREFYRQLQYLKEMGAVISFSRSSNVYYYTEDFDLFVNVSVKTSINQKVRTIYACKTPTNEKILAKFSARRDLTGCWRRCHGLHRMFLFRSKQQIFSF